MANEFDHLLPPKDAKIPDNINVNVNPFSHLLPTEETQKFKNQYQTYQTSQDILEICVQWTHF